MDPSATRATLKVLGLCAILLLLVAAVTVSVAVMVWHTEAARQLKACHERASNETVALVERVAELERERAEHGKQLEKLAQREKELQRQLSQAKEGKKRLNATLITCWENTVCSGGLRRRGGRVAMLENFSMAKGKSIRSTLLDCTMYYFQQ